MRGARELFCIALALASTIGSGTAQIPTDDPKAAQAKWYERVRERPDLVAGAFEVLRFPTGYTVPPPFERDPLKRKLLLDPNFFCSRCAKEGRMAAKPGAFVDRLMDRGAEPLWASIQDLCKDQAVYLEDANFKLVASLTEVNLRLFVNPFLKEELAELSRVFPEVNDKTAGLNGHQRAHHYLNRMNRLLRDFYWISGVDQPMLKRQYGHLGPIHGMRGKHEVYLFRRDRDYERFTLDTIGRKAPFGQVWHLFHDGSLVLQTFEGNLTDPHFQSRVFHLLGHNLIDGFLAYTFKLPAWFQTGMGAWFERRESIQSNTFCYSEGVVPDVFNDHKWLPKIRKRVATGDLEAFAEVMNRNEYGQSKVGETLIHYSWVCYLWRLGPEKMPKFLQILKSKQPTQSLYEIQVKAFKEAYGITPLQFETAWKAWVLEIYPEV